MKDEVSIIHASIIVQHDQLGFYQWGPGIGHRRRGCTDLCNVSGAGKKWRSLWGPLTREAVAKHQQCFEERNKKTFAGHLLNNLEQIVLRELPGQYLKEL